MRMTFLRVPALEMKLSVQKIFAVDCAVDFAVSAVQGLVLMTAAQSNLHKSFKNDKGHRTAMPPYAQI